MSNTFYPYPAFGIPIRTTLTVKPLQKHPYRMTSGSTARRIYASGVRVFTRSLYWAVKTPV